MMAEGESRTQDATDPTLGLLLTASSLRPPGLPFFFFFPPGLPSVRQGLSPASSPTSESPRKEARSHFTTPFTRLDLGMRLSSPVLGLLPRWLNTKPCFTLGLLLRKAYVVLLSSLRKRLLRGRVIPAEWHALREEGQRLPSSWLFWRVCNERHVCSGKNVHFGITSSATYELCVLGKFFFNLSGSYFPHLWSVCLCNK